MVRWVLKHRGIAGASCKGGFVRARTGFPRNTSRIFYIRKFLKIDDAQLAAPLSAVAEPSYGCSVRPQVLRTSDFRYPCGGWKT